MLRDTRISRKIHARFVHNDAARQFVIEEPLDSRHGVWVNGERIEQDPDASSKALGTGDRVRRARRLQDPAPSPREDEPSASARCGRKQRQPRGSLGQSGSRSSPLAAELVFQSMRRAELGSRRSYDRHGSRARLPTALRRGTHPAGPKRAVPVRARAAFGKTSCESLTGLIQHALESRRDLFSMSFDPDGGLQDPEAMGNTVLRPLSCAVRGLYPARPRQPQRRRGHPGHPDRESQRRSTLPRFAYELLLDGPRPAVVTVSCSRPSPSKPPRYLENAPPARAGTRQAAHG